jgi:Uma2 family endonuclease
MSSGAAPVTIIHIDDEEVERTGTTRQFNWIVLLHSNLETQYRDEPNVFVAGNHLIYAAEGQPTVRQAPDVYVAFGRPKGDRGSYKVWEEGGTFPQVVFEVWSPSNRFEKMQEKFGFYEKRGAEEYYIIYPEFPMHAEGWKREGGTLVRIAEMNGHISPRLGLRFVLVEGELTVFDPHRRPLRSPTEIAAERELAERQAREAEQQAEDAKRLAAKQEARAAKLAAKLRELGIDPDTV